LRIRGTRLACDCDETTGELQLVVSHVRFDTLACCATSSTPVAWMPFAVKELSRGHARYAHALRARHVHAAAKWCHSHSHSTPTSLQPAITPLCWLYQCKPISVLKGADHDG
jgi:hypothetical protein